MADEDICGEPGCGHARVDHPTYADETYQWCRIEDCGADEKSHFFVEPEA